MKRTVSSLNLMKRQKEKESDDIDLFSTLPSELLSIIMILFHHTVSNVNTISKYWYDVIVNYKGCWFDIATKNYALLLGGIPPGNGYTYIRHYNNKNHIISRIDKQGARDAIQIFDCYGVISDIRSIVYVFAKFDQTYSSNTKEEKYIVIGRFKSYIGFLLNSKFHRFSMFKDEKSHRVTEQAIMIDSIHRYISSNLSHPLLAFKNFHKRDIYLNFEEKSHCYDLTVPRNTINEIEDTRYEVIKSAIVSEDDNDALINIDNKDGINVDVCLFTDYSKITPNAERVIFAKHPQLLSVTTFIHTLYPKFISKDIIEKNKKRYAEPKSEYYGMTAEEIETKWRLSGELASKEGTAMHLNLEMYYNKEKYFNDTIEFGLFKVFEKEHIEGKLRAYRTEWTVFNEDLYLVGSIDILYEYIKEDTTNKDGKKHLVLMDWKRSKEIRTYAGYDNEYCGGGCVPCTRHAPDCNKTHYAIQLCLYKIMLESKYDVIIDAMFIVVLHPNQKKYLKIEIEWEVARFFIEGIVTYRLDTITEFKENNKVETDEQKWKKLSNKCFEL